MNKFVRVLLVLLSLVLLCGLVLTFASIVEVPMLSNLANNLRTTYTWVPTFLAVVVLFFILATVVALLCDFFVPNRDKFTIDRDKGHIQISDKSIESVANMAMDEIPGVRRHAAKVKVSHHHKVKLDLYAETNNDVPLSSISAALQDRVAQRLAESLDVSTSHIHLRMEPYKEAATSRAVQAPRVV